MERRRALLVLFLLMISLASHRAAAILSTRSNAVMAKLSRPRLTPRRHRLGVCHLDDAIVAAAVTTSDTRLFVSQIECNMSTFSTDRIGDSQDSDGPTILRPLIVCGPSGVGKGTIIERFMSPSGPYFGSSRFSFAVSHTTRQPRPGEVNGVHYHFVGKERMREDIARGRFLEHAEVHGNLYGTSFLSLEAVQEEGKTALLDIDVQGVRSVKKVRDRLDERLAESVRGEAEHKRAAVPPPESVLRPRFVFIAPPSLEVLRERLRGRGTETEESLARRTANAEAELEYGLGDGNFDYVVVNNNLDEACEEFDRIVKFLYR